MGINPLLTEGGSCPRARYHNFYHSARSAELAKASVTYMEWGFLEMWPVSNLLV
jgi:hypothetical protein